MDKKSQIAIEFLLLMGLALTLCILVLLSITVLSANKTDEKTYYEIDDFGKSVQQELVLSSGLEDGYMRRLNIPETINGRDFNMTIGQTSQYNGYMIIGYHGQEFYYIIPVVNGTLKKGDNLISKINNTIYIS